MITHFTSNGLLSGILSISPSKYCSIICFSRIHLMTLNWEYVKCWRTREASRIAKPLSNPWPVSRLLRPALRASVKRWELTSCPGWRSSCAPREGRRGWTVGSDRCSERRKAVDGQKEKEKLIVFKGGGGGGIFT